jgi:hypothetical protein
LLASPATGSGPKAVINADPLAEIFGNPSIMMLMVKVAFYLAEHPLIDEFVFRS